MRFELPRPVTLALETLRQNGYAAYLVGGCVRDDTLGIPPHDYDICTCARPEQTRACFAGYKTIDTGLKHGTLTVLIDRMPLEITTFRTDGDYADGRHPQNVSFTPNLEDDLKRRDFTINAMAWSPWEGFVDVFGGRADCEKRVIRCVGNPQERFTEDALRILRAVRFASKLGFHIDVKTADAMRALRQRLQMLSRERIYNELNETLCGKHAAQALDAYFDIVCEALPCLRPMQSCPQRNRYHIFDVWRHTLRALENVPPSPRLRWAALLHDVGKPSVHEITPEGWDSFHGHQAESARMAEDILRGLKASNAFIRDVCTLVRWHDEHLSRDEQFRVKIRRLTNKVGKPLMSDMLLLKRADILAHAPEVAQKADEWYAQACAMYQDILDKGDCVTVSDMHLNGNDLKTLGVSGQRTGEILQALFEQVLDGALSNERPSLLDGARRILSQE